MDIRDFEGLTKFKIILPIIYIISWVSMFMGPSFYPVAYQYFSLICFAQTIIKVCNVMIGMIYATYKSQGVFNRIRRKEDQNNYQDLNDATEQQINYGFIIPNYKQDIELLSETLEFLAAHKKAKTNYMIFLAMEAHEPDSEKKAEYLMEAFKNYFRLIIYTKHELRQYQQKGKASNVSWCAQHLEPVFQKYMIDEKSVFLTILDADSWAPQIYYDILEDKIREEYQDRHQRIYMPSQIFTRNNLDVPVFTRVYDILHSFAHVSNLMSLFELTFPLSNYTVSYTLMKNIGFWDTCPDAIGEDFHTTQKAYWKTRGQIKTRPIFASFNQVNISTGNGYCSDVKARFWQAQRHAKGVSDVAYNIKMLLNQPFRFKNIVVFYQVFEAFVIIALIPWVALSLNYQNHILYQYTKPSPQLYSNASIGYLFTILSFIGTPAYFLYQIFKRRSNRIIYKQENQSILRIFEYLLTFFFVFSFMGVPSFVIAAFSVVFGNQEYVVAEKKSASLKHPGS